MKVQVLFFAHFKQVAGSSRLEIELPPGGNLADLKQALLERFPGMAPLMESVVVSLDRKYADDGDILSEGVEVAFFPPVSGGQDLPTIVKLSATPLSTDEVVRSITLAGTGAVVSFTGVVRGVTDGISPRKTDALEYEAYAPMAQAKLEQVASEIRERWPAVQGIAILQRTGLQAAGEISVVVACSAAHRDTGVFDAARYGIDRLKEIVPVWKKEIGPGGEEWVEGHYHPRKTD